MKHKILSNENWNEFCEERGLKGKRFDDFAQAIIELNRLQSEVYRARNEIKHLYSC
jgi:hypothetical protein